MHYEIAKCISYLVKGSKELQEMEKPELLKMIKKAVPAMMVSHSLCGEMFVQYKDGEIKVADPDEIEIKHGSVYIKIKGEEDGQ